MEAGYLVRLRHSQSLELGHEFRCRRIDWNGEEPDPQYQDEDSFSHDGQEIIAAEFAALGTAFAAMEHLVVTPIEDLPLQAGRPLDELLRQIAGLPQEPVSGLAEAVSAAIIAKNVGGYCPGDFLTESHVTLKTVEDATGVTVYAMAYYVEYDFLAKGPKDVSGSHIPVAITFAKDGNSRYTLTEYWEAEDGSRYAPSIREKFPADIADQGMDTQLYIEQQMEEADNKAMRYLRERDTIQQTE